MLKILIVGSDKIFAIENFYHKYLKEFGVNVEMFCAFNIFIDYYQANIINKIFFKAGLSLIYKKINRQFIEKIKDYRPNVILVFKGMEISPASLALAKTLNIKLVNYNPDNPFVFSGMGSGNRYVTDSISLYDLHLTYDHSVKEKLEKEYNLKTAILPFAFDDSDVLYNDCCRQKEVLKLGFVGNPDVKRAAFIEALAVEDIKIDVYGVEWRKFLSHPNIAIFPPVYGVDTWKALRRYRAQLNLMRAHNEDSHNMRSFEVPGIGGIMVAPDTPDHRMYFEDGKEIFVYQDVVSCADIVKRLLDLNVDEVNGIRAKARSRSILSGYSYKDRSLQLLHYLEALNKSEL